MLGIVLQSSDDVRSGNSLNIRAPSDGYAVSAIGGERRLEQGLEEFEQISGQPCRFVEIEDPTADLDTIGEHLLGESPDFVALVKDRLLRGVGLGN